MSLRFIPAALYRPLILSAALTLAALRGWAQATPLQQLEARLRRGEVQALTALAPYLDSRKLVPETLGYHLLQTPESTIALRLLAENCLFTDTEMQWQPAPSAQQFRAFLALHRPQIVFSPLAAAFLITPLAQRPAPAQLRPLSPIRRQELEKQAFAWFGQPWAAKARLDSLIQRRDPVCLLRIAAALFRARERFAQEPQPRAPYLGLLQLLTGTEFGVADEWGQLSWHADEDFAPASQLNLLLYFAATYPQYTWNAAAGAFQLPGQRMAEAGHERQLFELLRHPADSTAQRAFAQLTTCDPATVGALCTEYDRGLPPTNYQLPSFPFRFLRQLSELTAYCRTNGIGYTASPGLRRNLAALAAGLPFAEQYRLENQLIATLTPAEVTALEYETLLQQKSYALGTSSGRILDVWYSRHWPQLLADPQQLALFLKKVVLFRRLGIHGYCYNYGRKFLDAAPATLSQLRDLSTQDADIEQLRDTLLHQQLPVPRPAPAASPQNDDHPAAVTDLAGRLHTLAPQQQADAPQQAELVKLLADISYPQIGEALRYIEPIVFADPRAKYSFLRSDWGFFWLDDVQQPTGREQFLRQYDQLSEQALYTTQLRQAGIDYQDATGRPDYDKVYELLQYDVSYALAGGGGTPNERAVYALIRVLELHFGTTLGFPPKRCHSANRYSCTIGDRVAAWQHFLRQLLRQPHQAPPSFGLD